jgi:hypothetical protein
MASRSSTRRAQWGTEYNILDFSNWKDDAEFTMNFTKLAEGLDLFYKEK